MKDLWESVLTLAVSALLVIAISCLGSGGRSGFLVNLLFVTTALVAVVVSALATALVGWVACLSMRLDEEGWPLVLGGLAWLFVVAPVTVKLAFWTLRLFVGRSYFR